MSSEKKPTGLELLRVPFAANQISKLPKPYKADSPKGKCAECGGYHGLPAVHLDYVGHAALTDRLLDADPAWTWEPMSITPEGLPRFDESGGLWIRLTVCGVSRLGYGNAERKPRMDVGSREKEVIGDALRNAAMRFGAALDLWHKGQLHVDDEAETPKVVDVVTGAEVEPSKADAPDGYHYVVNYHKSGDWHEATVLKWDLKGGALVVSTKREQLGGLLLAICRDGVPAMVSVKVKSGRPGEAYLEDIKAYKKPQPVEPLADELDADSIPF